ncbi:hypothetical protein TRIUR3_24309 [Triticum urartu]|uniref:Uncharacterized protein n=1 Tax=Triticum urartu TaxID=4572 RepID=M8A8J4_TRIUA|nr:hypothetical protein TRIUR3_24309 [Triticum urartu]
MAAGRSHGGGRRGSGARAIMGQVGNKESDGSESCFEQTSAPDGGVVTHAPSHLDDPSEISFIGQIVYPLCLTALKLTEMKHHDYPSCSQQANSDTGENRPSLELQGMGAAQQNPNELVPEPERCEPTVKEAAAEHAHGRHVPDEGLPQTKASIRRLLPSAGGGHDAQGLKKRAADRGGAKASAGDGNWAIGLAHLAPQSMRHRWG